MELDNAVNQGGSNDSDDLREVLSELHAWRQHVNRKDAADDEQLLQVFTDMGRTVTTVHQRTQRFRNQSN